MRLARLPAALAAFFLLAPAPPVSASSLIDRIYDVSTAEAISRADLVEALAQADLVILGEHHDNADAHRWQAALVAELDAARGVTGLAFEMFGPDREEAANAKRAAGAPVASLEPVLGWENWPDFAMYAPIFEAAPRARLTGGALPRGDLMRLAGAPEDWPGAERFGVTRPLPEAEQTQREAEQAAAHCDMLPEEMLPAMVSVQQLRDASFAEALLRARRDEGEGGGAAVLITGNGHARVDRGAPRMLRRAAPGMLTLSVGILELTPAEARRRYAALFDTAPPYDFVIFTPSVDRGDPCEAFRQQG